MCDDDHNDAERGSKRGGVASVWGKGWPRLAFVCCDITLLLNGEKGRKVSKRECWTLRMRKIEYRPILRVKV